MERLKANDVAKELSISVCGSILMPFVRDKAGGVWFFTREGSIMPYQEGNHWRG